MSTITVRDLKYGCLGQPLRLRVLRRWIPHYKKEETWFLGVDKDGNAIALVAENADQKPLEAKLQIQGCFTFSNYTCLEASHSQRFMRNPLHLSIGSASTISDLDDNESLPTEWFDFSTLDEFRSLIRSPEFYPDFIGYFKKFSDKQTVHRNPMTHITVTNPMTHITVTSSCGEDLVVTLWKDCIEDSQKFDRLLLNACTSQSTIAFTNLRPSYFSDRLQLASTDATYVVFNPITVTNALCLQRHPASASTPDVTLTLSELESHKYEDVSKKKIGVRAWLTSFNVGQSWFVALCSTVGCRKSIAPQGTSWFCTSHADVKHPLFYFSFTATISDGDSVLSVILTDNFVNNLIGSTCEKIIVNDGHTDRKTIPATVQQHVMRPYHMILELAKNATKDNLTFAATSLSNGSLIQTNETIMPIPKTYSPHSQIEVLPTPSLSDTPPPPGSTNKDTQYDKATATLNPDVNNLPTAKKLNFDLPPPETSVQPHSPSKRSMTTSKGKQEKQVPSKRINPTK